MIDKYELNNDYLKYIYQGMIEVTTFEGPTYEQGTAFPAFKDFPITVAGKQELHKLIERNTLIHGLQVFASK